MFIKVIATALFGLAVATTFASANESKPHAADHAMHGPSGQMHHAMMNGMHKAMDMKMSGNVDRDFATMMIDHHRQAVEMAKIQVANGSNAELKAMAQKMIDAQQKEIAELEQFAD